jgi:hypothetical protein
MHWFRKLNASYLCCNLIKYAVYKVVYKVFSLATKDFVLIKYHVPSANNLGYRRDLYLVDV